MKTNKFKVISSFKTTHSQQQSIDTLALGLEKNAKYQTLMGVTGSGKTYIMSKIIEEVQKPTLIIAHNKTLASQLAQEFRKFFPHNKVAYFVSYYDYYQPEAYMPTTDLYIEKETQINEEIERYRSKATQYLLTRNDTIVVSSVSCIYGLGSPEEYSNIAFEIKVGEKISRNDIFSKLISMQYTRNEIERDKGTFSSKGEMIEIIPPYEDHIIRVEFLENIVETIKYIDNITRKTIEVIQDIYIYPAKHYLIQKEKMKKAIENILKEKDERVKYFKKLGKLVEAQRIESKVKFDIEMMQELGYTSGIENYSRHLEERAPGSHSFTLMDFFPKDFLLFIDESHITLPQIKGMYNGDRARKQTLIDYGFRLPSALDNRPLKFLEFQNQINKAIFVSATPQEYEKILSKESTNSIKKYPESGIVEQIIRPTHLLDPIVEIRTKENQIEDIQKEIKKRVKNNERTLVLTLTKKMAESLSDYLINEGFKTQYLHGDLDTIERTDILRSLRLGEYDVIVGINLLREGLDLPEVSLIIILDADKEGFLRSKDSFIQIMGRASRHINGNVILYAEETTKSMKNAIAETKRRRKIQDEYNKRYNLIPQSIQKPIDVELQRQKKKDDNIDFNTFDTSDKNRLIKELTLEMQKCVKSLQFEKAAIIRDKIKELKLL